MKLISLLPLFLGLSINTSSAGNHCDHLNPRGDDHAPISIMGDHIHSAGDWMLSYRYMFMQMDDLYSGSSKISPGQAFGANYTVSPTSMTMDMHMLGVMYAPSDRVTLMAMLPYIDLEMDHMIFPGAAPLLALNGGRPGFTTQSNGIGDLKLTSLISIFQQDGHHLHGGIGFSIPTGSISEQDLIPGPGGLIPRQLPAAMQLGSGTFDILPSLTWVRKSEKWSAGAQMRGVIRTHTNYHDYRLGDQVGVDAWASWNASEWCALSAGIGYLWEDELSGVQSDVSLNPPFAPTRRTVTTAFGENYGGQRIEAIVGANFVVPCGPLIGHRLAFDVRLPLWQDRNGISLGTNYTLTAGWQYAF
ncbi:transporter [Haloferula sp.]|uniref:transporter n=1 Tax=Haloferula sp. TaxID=2497595 RepID=UPI00329B644E